jgi:hypothetical protein
MGTKNLLLAFSFDSRFGAAATKTEAGGLAAATDARNRHTKPSGF